MKVRSGVTRMLKPRNVRFGTQRIDSRGGRKSGSPNPISASGRGIKRY